MSAEEVAKWSGRAKPGMPLFDGPQEVRDDFIRSHGVDWVASYLDSATWIPTSRAIVPYSTTAHARLEAQGSFMLRKLGISLRPVSNVVRMAAE